jgi:hypothetical protein
MQRLFQIIGAVSIVALSFAAVTESFAQSIGSLPAKQLCWHALNPDTLSTRDQSPNYSGYVAEAERRGLTVDACRQVIGAAGERAIHLRERTERAIHLRVPRAEADAEARQWSKFSPSSLAIQTPIRRKPIIAGLFFARLFFARLKNAKEC